MHSLTIILGKGQQKGFICQLCLIGSGYLNSYTEKVTSKNKQKLVCHGHIVKWLQDSPKALTFPELHREKNKISALKISIILCEKWKLYTIKIWFKKKMFVL